MKADYGVARRAIILAALVFPISTANAQKIKVGYDKSVDFGKFSTYSWADPAMPPVRPILYDSVIARVDQQLNAKGWVRTEHNGDLIVTPAGGLDFGLAGGPNTPILPTYPGPPPAYNATMWTGAGGPSTAGTYVTEGTLILTFVDRSSNKTIWSGSVKEKLDLERKTKSLELADKAVIKLLKKFPARSGNMTTR